MGITGYEAHVLLYAFDSFYQTDEQGKVPLFVAGPASVYRIPREKLQELRDKLFAVHEHEDSQTKFKGE